MEYSSLKDTWTKKSSLHTSSFNPFKNQPIPEHEIKENFYVNQANTYRVCSNVTPANSVQMPSRFYNVRNGLIQPNTEWKNNYFCS